MAATIDAPAKCELRSVIRFLQAEGRSAAEIHCRMSKVYGENFYVISAEPSKTNEEECSCQA